MTKINPGSLWKIAKNPNGGGFIVRSANAVHTSAAVHKQNAKLAKAAHDCAGKGEGRAGFRQCVAEKIKGKV